MTGLSRVNSKALEGLPSAGQVNYFLIFRRGGIHGELQQTPISVGKR